METLRILTALEDLLGSLGPQINIVLSKAITLENNKEGSGNVLLEDQDVAVILQMTKEKLSGQIIAGVLSYFDNSSGVIARKDYYNYFILMI